MILGKRVLLCGRHLEELRPLLPSQLEIVEEHPEFVISYGGDGALLGAERNWPGIPKIPIRDRRMNPKCSQHAEELHLEQVLNGQLQVDDCLKLRAVHLDSGSEVVALNDITIHNLDPRSAVRYRVWVDGRAVSQNVVGDGVVIATPFGSSAYYRSITHSTFSQGIGLAFNNSTEPLDHMVLSPEVTIRIQITRGPAVLFADNDPAQVVLAEGEFIEVSRLPQSTKIYGLDVFRCKECQQLRSDFWQGRWPG